MYLSPYFKLCKFHRTVPIMVAVGLVLSYKKVI